MKPAAFAYYDPTGTAEALETLAALGDDAKVLAGGQSLVPMMNMRLAKPGVIIDINRIKELASINDTPDGLLIGTLTRQRAVERSRVVKKRSPLLAEAIFYVGHPPIRSRGSVGGSLAHADPAAELPAVLLALDGWVRVVGPKGTREIPAADLAIGPLVTSIEPDELLTEVWFPALPSGSGTAFLEITRRHGDFALVGVAACLTLDEREVCTRASIALLGVGETPQRAAEAEAGLVSSKIDERAIEAAGAAAMSGLDPTGDIHASPEYRRQVAGALTQRALALAWQRARPRSER